MHTAPAHEDCLGLPSGRVPDSDNWVERSSNIGSANVLTVLPPVVQFQTISSSSRPLQILNGVSAICLRPL